MAKGNKTKAGNTGAAKVGRKALTDEQKEARKAELAAEGKDKRFLRLGQPRINKAIRSITILGNLSGSNYSYTAAQVDAIEKALKKAVEDTMAKFRREKREAAAVDLSAV